jgi:hypothetical protein
MMIRTTRRTFVRGTAAAAFVAPFLRLLERPGQAATIPKRLVLFIVPNGTVMSRYWNANKTWGMVLDPLIPFKNKMLVMRGLDNRVGHVTPIEGHKTDWPSLLTGKHPSKVDTSPITTPVIEGQSLENYIGNYLVDKQMVNTKYPVYYLGARTELRWPLFATGPQGAILPENDPVKAFSALFANYTFGPGTGPTGPDPAVERLLKRRQSVLDAVKSDLSAVRCELGAEERSKFDAHLDAVLAAERSLTAGSGDGVIAGACSKYTIPAIDYKAMGNYGPLINAQIDNAVAALACDRVRVIGMQMERYQSPMVFKGMVPGLTSSNPHHTIVHQGTGDGSDKSQALGLIDQWYAQRFAYLLGKMDKIVESNGKTLLDNSAVLWMHEQSDAPAHLRYDHGMVLAGSQNGYFKQNDMLDFRTGKEVDVFKSEGNVNTVQEGQPHVRLLMNLAESMGVPFAPSAPLNGNVMTAQEKSYFAAGPLSEVRA